MKVGRALVAGIVGGLVMTAVGLLGLAIHLVASGLIALIYAGVFEHVAHRAGWLIGAVAS